MLRRLTISMFVIGLLFAFAATALAGPGDPIQRRSLKDLQGTVVENKGGFESPGHFLPEGLNRPPVPSVMQVQNPPTRPVTTGTDIDA